MTTSLANIHIGFREKKIILVSVSVILLLIVTCIELRNVVIPKFDRLAASLENLRSSRRILALKEKNLTEQQDNETRLSTIDSNELTGRIPNQAQAPAALVFLSQEMAGKGITETGFYMDPYENYNLDGLSEGENLISQNVTLTGTGRYADALRYIESLANAEYFYKPVSYTITSRDMLAQDSVLLTLSLELFILNEPKNHHGAVQPKVTGEKVSPVIKNPFYYDE